MMKPRIVKGETVYDIVGYDYESDMETIIICISNRFDAVVTEKLDGPDATIWYISINGNPIVLVNDSWGSFLKAKNLAAQEMLESNLDLI